MKNYKSLFNDVAMKDLQDKNDFSKNSSSYSLLRPLKNKGYTFGKDGQNSFSKEYI
jgi:hypothetical protein